MFFLVIEEKFQQVMSTCKKGGFTYSELDRVFFEAGFKTRVGGRREEMYELFLVAFKQEKSNEQIQKIAIPFIPSPQMKS